MINIFEEAFKQNAALNSMADTKNLKRASKAKKTSVTEAVAAPQKVDLSDKPRSITSILTNHKADINSAASVRELIDKVISWFEEVNLDTAATKRVIKNLYKKRDVESAQFYLYSVILKGSGLGVEESKSKIALNKIKFNEDVESFQPDDGVMVVYSSDITDDMSEEDIQAAASELIGQDICKCGICGANYVCSCKSDKEELLVSDEDDFVEIELGESLLFTEDSEELDETDENSEEDDTECPVCGASENQIVVGEIAPIEEVTPDDEASDDKENSDGVPNDEADGDDLKAEETVEDTELDDDYVEVDERLINRLFTKFAKENFENVKSVKFKSGRLVGGEIVLEGLVTTKSNNTRNIKLTSKGFKLDESTRIIKVFENGPFTESASVKENRVPFVLECVVSGKSVRFTGLKYNYNVRESNNLYSVYGKVDLKERKSV